MTRTFHGLGIYLSIIFILISLAITFRNLSSVAIEPAISFIWVNIQSQNLPARQNFGSANIIMLKINIKSAENILIIEDAPYSVVKEAYQNCRFTIFPSIWHEPCATVAFEAMSYKKAIIASEVGGFADVVGEGETGILVPPNDSEALATAIEHLLQRPQVAEEMGQRGYERWRQNFSAEAVVPQVEQLYKSLTQ